MSTIDLKLLIWRQKNSDSLGDFETHVLKDISTDMSFLEMLDVLNEKLTKDGMEPVAFDHDCREGICGMCGAVVNGVAHGPEKETTLCQLHMRKFASGDTLVIEPFRSRAFPIKKDLMVDRSSLDRIIQAGGYVSVNTGGAIDGNTTPVSTETAELAMDAAACIGCGACVASCPNGAAMLFTGAKISQLSLLPQGHAERKQRATAMVAQMDKEGFGYCSNERECEAVCPKGISISSIARMNREYLKGVFFGR
ncbi:succinate dehydrogenase/fumarate reductase iron-sulfur subunit [Desulfofustis glycolicus]|uniref:Succinate dehydrogenase subunit B n=1 Tax=Desulfofustis glycolicus DSM 9705 TaxID=1121409 RepID=A0A1M5UAD5_9BACT|nr:succinate dehydrogenase/fumarate reductase iron-sulfur subunit [Desulfofustis glycolicus]MCB2214556.1 succinate dehydrogenase/fumarate reductase iron-sulfur subunit [Desulfobulbaceae bacterium]SHH59982.1 succinate dehydrogenase subunit B [Desulfofustis glycolicus DSM 9705]